MIKNTCIRWMEFYGQELAEFLFDVRVLNMNKT